MFCWSPSSVNRLAPIEINERVPFLSPRTIGGLTKPESYLHPQ